MSDLYSLEYMRLARELVRVLGPANQAIVFDVLSGYVALTARAAVPTVEEAEVIIRDFSDLALRRVKKVPVPVPGFGKFD